MQQERSCKQARGPIDQNCFLPFVLNVRFFQTSFNPLMRLLRTQSSRHCKQFVLQWTRPNVDSGKTMQMTENVKTIQNVW